MANHLAKEGQVKIGTAVVAELRSFNWSETAEPVDDSELADDWATTKTGRKRWSGTIECWWDETDTLGQGALVVGANVAIHFQHEGDAVTSTEYTGNGVVTEIQRTSQIDSIVEAVFSVVGDGAIAAATL